MWKYKGIYMKLMTKKKKKSPKTVEIKPVVDHGASLMEVPGK